MYHHMGFAANTSSNEVKNLGNFYTGGAGPSSGSDDFVDTTLRLKSPGSFNFQCSASKGIKRKWSSLADGLMDVQGGLPFCLRLGHSSSSSDSKGSSVTGCTTVSSAKETDEESSMDLEFDFSLNLGCEKVTRPKNASRSDMKPVDGQHKIDLELSLSSGLSRSDMTAVHPSSVSENDKLPATVTGDLYMVEQSMTPHWKARDSDSPLQNSPNSQKSFFLNQALIRMKPASAGPTLSSSTTTGPKSSGTCTSGITQHQSSSSKTCQFKGCFKGARGASGLCIAHGGGRRCQRFGCNKGAEGRTAYCKAHGGGRRCEFLGCTKSAEGRTDYCIAHGGGRRCSHENCTRAARGKSGLCIRHGGGKRCQKESCTKSAEGLSGLCISHGGGRRCQTLGCSKGAQGSTMFCKAHGGGKRCTFEGCTKGAEGSTPFCKGHGGGKRCAFEGGGICPKSVHGGTLFCVAHGGGKRCAVPECTKSARGRTDFCVRHGGGRRCKFEGCGKSAQGSTDFCKAHGGGRRCLWGQPGSEFGKGDGICNLFARGKSGLCATHAALVQDKRVHGGATLGALADPNLSKSEKTKAFVTDQERTIDFSFRTSARSSGSVWEHVGIQQGCLPTGPGSSSVSRSVPEGRVHGGILVAMLAGNSGFPSEL